MAKKIEVKPAGEKMEQPFPEISEAEKLRITEEKGGQMLERRREQLLAQKEQAKKDFEKELKKLSLPEGYSKDPKVFEETLDSLKAKNPKLLPKFIDIHRKMLKQVSVDTALGLFEHYSDKSYAKDVLIFFTKKEPMITISDTGESELFTKLPYYDEVLETAVKTDPSIVLELFDLYADKPYVRDMIKAGAEKDPWKFVNNFEDLKQFFPDNADFLFAKHRERIKIAEEGSELPQETIKITDFPIERKEFELYLLGINYKIGGYIKILGSPESRTIFFSKPFQAFLKNQAGKMSYMNAFSLADAVHINLEQEKKALTEDNIKASIEFNENLRERVSQRELFGPNTKLILFTHREEVFKNEEIVEKLFLRSGGKKENLLVSAKGVEMEADKNVMKEKVLTAIRNAKEGPVTILFSGHGSPENWGFSKNRLEKLDHSLDSHANSINFQELGDALIASGNIRNINLMGACCYAYDYLQNLFKYIESKGVKEKPYVSISFANKGQPAFGLGKELHDPIFDAFYNLTKKGEPIKAHHFFKAEAQPLVWKYNDPALFHGENELF